MGICTAMARVPFTATKRSLLSLGIRVTHGHCPALVPTATPFSATCAALQHTSADLRGRLCFAIVGIEAARAATMRLHIRAGAHPGTVSGLPKPTGPILAIGQLHMSSPCSLLAMGILAKSVSRHERWMERARSMRKL
jgi:hypothetical protein